MEVEAAALTQRSCDQGCRMDMGYPLPSQQFKDVPGIPSPQPRSTYTAAKLIFLMPPSNEQL